MHRAQALELCRDAFSVVPADVLTEPCCQGIGVQKPNPVEEFFLAVPDGVLHHCIVIIVALAGHRLDRAGVLEHGAPGQIEYGVYTSAGFRALAAGLGMRSSMGRTGVCWDKSMAKSFFAALRNERVYRTVYATKSPARSDLTRYIEALYNSRRRHSALGYRRPNEVHYGYQQPDLAA